MTEAFTITSLLIVGAVGTYVLGFLCRDQIHIRALVVLGSIFYAVYYWIAGPVPLWDAILGSLLILIASLQGIVRLIWSRQPLAVPKGTEHIFARIGNIEPGLFRSLMSVGKLRKTETSMILTTESTEPETLWFVVSGEIVLERKGHPSVTLRDAGFVGEIAWVSGGGASATVILKPGAEVVEWPHADLLKATKRSQRLELALEALIAQNLAQKLAFSAPLERTPSGGGKVLAAASPAFEPER